MATTTGAQPTPPSGRTERVDVEQAALGEATHRGLERSARPRCRGGAA